MKLSIQMRSGGLALAFAAGLLVSGLAGKAAAVPVTYAHTGGTATITLSLGEDPTIIGSATLPVTGIFATFDEGTIELVDFDIRAAGAIPFDPGVMWGGFSDVILMDAALAPGPGYTHISQVDLGGGQYSVSVNPVQISTSVTASGSSEVWDGSPISGLGPTSATIDIFGAGNQISINGITIGQIDGSSAYLSSPELEDLTIKADFVFEGQVPEPSVGILLGMGGVALLCLRRLNDR